MDSGRDNHLEFPRIELAKVVPTPELRNIINVLRKLPPSKTRKKLSKQDLKDILHGKNAADFRTEFTVIKPVIEKIKKPTPKSTPKLVPVPRTHSPAIRKHIVSHCPHCNGRRFRVVDPGRPDNRRILECARRDCLASIRYTTYQEGIMFGDALEDGSYGWYLKDPAEIFYPVGPIDKNYTYGRELKTEILRDEKGRISIRCPGQKKLVPVT